MTIFAVICAAMFPGLHRGWAGAIFSGFALVLTLMLITRVVFKLEDYITLEHIALMNKIMMVTTGYCARSYGRSFWLWFALGALAPGLPCSG